MSPDSYDRAAKRDFRPDIQGLRAVAVLLVTLGHAGIAWLAGGYVGVDVFFVISGFLITGLLIRDWQRDGRIRILAFYARRARRILPAAFLTLVVTDLAALYLVNYVRARDAIWDSLWATFFAANIQFERIGTDYFASSSPLSPIQHFWSLAVEEQFYLVWPALLGALLVGSVAFWRGHRSTDDHVRRAAAAAFVITCASLGWSIYLTHRSPAVAYFSTFTRAWELGVGAGLALSAASVARIHQIVRDVLSWIGLAVIVAAGVVYTSATPFPGLAALLPVLGCGLVIAGGIGGYARGASLVLSLPPLRFIGDVSYSFYLWHWPFLVIATDYAGTALTMPIRLALLIGAFTVSVVSYRWYESPLRHTQALGDRRSMRPLLLWPASILGVLSVTLYGLWAIGIQVDLAREAAAYVPSRTASSPSPSTPQDAAEGVRRAVALARSGAAIPASLSPPIDKLQNDFFIPDSGCVVGHNSDQTSGPICHFGDLRSSRTVILFGDSHAQSWLPPLVESAKDRGWNLVPLIKDGCPPQIIETDTNGCRLWLTWALGQEASLRPSVVIFAGCQLRCVPGQAWLDGARDVIRSLRIGGAQLVLLEDVPGLDKSPTDCLLAQGAKLASCTFPERAAVSAVDAQTSAMAHGAGADYVATQQWFCADGACPTVIGGSIAYTDTHHVTMTYALQLKGALTAAIGVK